MTKFPRMFLLLVMLVIPMVLKPQQSMSASPDTFEPITVENASQIRVIDTITDYQDTASFCACNVRFFSLNGQSVATDRKVQDLASGMTLDFIGRGYPLALSPDGALMLVSGQDAGTRLVEVNTGVEQVLMSDDAEIAVFSPDGTLLALSSIDADAVQVWEVETASLIATLGRTEPYENLESLSFTSDGRFLVWIGRFSTLNLWDAVEQSEERQIADNVFDFALSDDGRTISLRKYDFETVEVWDIESGELLGQVVDSMDQSGVDVYVVSPDRQTLAINYFGGNQRLEIWDISGINSQLVSQLDSNSYNGKLIFTPDSSFLLLTGGRFRSSCTRTGNSCSSSGGSGSSDIRIIDTQTGEEIASIDAQASDVTEAFLTYDGNLLITASRFGGTISLWAMDGINASLITILQGRDFVLSPDGSTLLAEIDRDFLAVYGIPTTTRTIQPFLLPGRIVPSSVNVRANPDLDSESIGIASGTVRALGRNAESSYVYLPESEGWVRAEPAYFQLSMNFPLETLTILDEISTTAATSTPTLVATSTPDATDAAPLPFDTVVDLGQLRLSIADAIIPPPQSADGLIEITPQNLSQVVLLAVLPQASIRPDDFPVVIPAISTDGSRLISPPTRSLDRITIWDLVTWEMRLGPELEYGYFIVMAADPSGNYVAYSTDDFFSTISLWSLDTDVSVRIPQIEAVQLFANSMVFSPDGQTLAFQGGLLDVSTRRIRAEIEDFGALTFSPDSTLLGIMSRDRVYLYDAETGEPIARTPRIASTSDFRLELQGAQFSPDNSLLAVVGYSQVNVFDTETGDLLYTIPTPSDENSAISQIAFSPDGQYLVILSPQGLLELREGRSGNQLGVYDTDGGQGIAFSPTGEVLTIGQPLRLINLITGEITTIPGNYAGSYLAFSPDGSMLLVDTSGTSLNDYQSVMIFGVPASTRPEWTPVLAQVVSAGINVRSGPRSSAPTIGSATGEISIAARDIEGEAVFLSNIEGWVWSAPEYIDLGDIQLDMLPVRMD